jgi:glycosyltransferase involved in cell wall biosynthesis
MSKVNSAFSCVTVIIPVYNSARYLQQCLDSIYAQTVQEFEVITINDGSTDESAEILSKYAKRHDNLTIINQKNHGQGYARNRALEVAKGKYILFVDADDYIEPRLLEKTVSRAEKDNADVVHYNWQMLQHGGTTPTSFAPFFGISKLQGEDCDQFLQKTNYFSWDSLYRKTLLDEHSICFGEGYIYEDNEFIVQIAGYAQTISLVGEPLYTMRWSDNSSTRSLHTTDRHAKDFLRAMQRCFKVLVIRTPHSSFYLAGYFLEKFIIYYQRRVPAQYRMWYLRGFVDVMQLQKLVPPPGSSYKFLRSCIKNDVFVNKKYRLFRAGVLYKTKVLPLLKYGMKGRAA